MQVNLKWSKQKFDGLQLDPAAATQVFKAKCAELTGVPPKKMKLMIKGSVVADEPDWAAHSAKLKDGMTLMLMGTADPNFRPAAAGGGGPAAAAGGGAAGELRLDDLLEQAAAAAAEPAGAAVGAEVAEADAAAAAKVAADDAEFGPPLCRVAVKHGTVEYVLHMRGLRGDGSCEGPEGSASATAAAATTFEELLVSDVMQQLFAASGTPPDQQKLVHKGAVLSAEMPLADPGLKFKQSKDGVPEAKFMLMGNSSYHRAQAEGTFLVTAEQELTVLEADCAAVIKTASHRADPAL